MSEVDLSLIPEEQLRKELFSRYDHSIFAGAKVGYEKDNAISYTHDYDGNSATCTGLAFQLSMKITNERIINRRSKG